MEVIFPDAAAVDAMGPNPLNPAYCARAAEAGLAQAAAAVEALTGIRERLGS